MKRKNFVIALIGAVALMGCSKNERVSSERELKIIPNTSQMIPGTKSAGDSFFATGDKIALAITDPNGTVSYTYSYNNGAFTGINANNTYHFYMDDETVNIKASWPAVPPTGFVSDQRLDADFKLSDYLTGELNLVMSTPDYIPINFKHQNSKVVFMLTGQNANGLAISSLVVNMGDKGYWAHIDPITGFAELILPPGPVYVYAGNIAGLVTVGGFTGSMIFGKTETYNLKPNVSYVVALSPRGDNMIATFNEGGWWQDENGVGVPLVLVDGYYQISTEAQLYAVAELIKNYKPDAAGVNWAAANYRLSGDIARSSRTWIPITGFTGIFDYSTFTITPDIDFSDTPII